MHSRAEARSGGSLALVGVTLVAGLATAAGLFSGRGAAALVIIGAALLAAVSALWSSLHEAASDDDARAVAAPTLARLGSDDELDAVLRSLLDLDHEVAVGKILPDDEAIVRRELRAEAKRLLKLQDARIDPALRERARAIVETALASAASAEPKSTCKSCPSCKAVLGVEDAFCKRCGTRIDGEVTR